MIGMAGALDRRMREMPMKIGELARQAGVGVETVRYYQRRGLLSVPERQGRACRSYPPDMVRTIRRIRVLRELGFSLDMIRDLLLSEAEGCPDVRVAIQGRIGADVWFGVVHLGPWQLHPLVLVYALSGSLMISKTLRIPKL